VLAVLFPGKERGGLFLLALVLLFAGLSYIGTTRRIPVLADDVPAPADVAAPEPGAVARRHLRARVRARRARPATPARDDPPDAFPAGS
jgi:hypothetical protein